LLASVGWDSAVRIWDVQTGQAVGAGECDAGSLHSVDWSPDGQRLVAGQGLYFGWNSAESLCVVGAPLASEQAQAPVGQTLSVTIVYDNTAYDPDLRAEWGFAAWIEYGGHTLLFDTGGDSPTLLNNMEKLGLDPQKIEAVVLSHIHGDHVGGLQGLLSTGITPTVYALASFPRSFKEAVRSQVELVEVRDGLEILPGLHSTGELQGPVVEQALAIETSEGLVVITGCAHPGIVRIVREARAIVDEDVALVLGGFHLMGTSASGVRGIISDLRQLGVRRASPTHCTGERAIAIFAENFGEDYEPGGAGRVFVVGGGEN
jgi:7,8-dihydropterin-6-yl-methyl-4-(beta-D-ribofuranosyl)aminobenzene 5'-phosphate synthase